MSVAAGGTGEGGELGDWDALLAAADLVVSTLCPVLYEARVHCACLWLGSEGAMGGGENLTFKFSCNCKYRWYELNKRNLKTWKLNPGTSGNS